MRKGLVTVLLAGCWLVSPVAAGDWPTWLDVRRSDGKREGYRFVSRNLFALAKGDGAKQWQYKTGAHILNSSIAVNEGTVCFVENRNSSLPGGLVLMPESSTGCGLRVRHVGIYCAGPAEPGIVISR